MHSLVTVHGFVLCLPQHPNLNTALSSRTHLVKSSPPPPPPLPEGPFVNFSALNGGKMLRSQVEGTE